MSDQEKISMNHDTNEIEASLREGRFGRSVLDPNDSPETVRQRFLARQGQYFFRDRNNALAFEDRGPRIATPTEDPMVAASMVDLAIAKGWKTLKVSGSESFRRTIWLEAARRGMDVRGYRPQPQDELQLQEMLKKSPTLPTVHELGPARASAFEQKTAEEALKAFPELHKVYAGRSAIHQWIDNHVQNPEKQAALRAAIDQGMVERLKKGEIPGVVVLSLKDPIDPRQHSAIHKQAVVMGAVAQAKGQPEETVRIIIAAAERIGRHLASQGHWIPEPLVYDCNAPPRPSAKPLPTDPRSTKPELSRQPKIQPRR